MTFQLAVAAAPAEAPESAQRSAKQFAVEFVSNFVVRSCGETRCEFVAAPDGPVVVQNNARFEITLAGRRREYGEPFEEKDVTATLSLERIPPASGLPGNWVVLDFGFTEGKAIPRPTK